MKINNIFFDAGSTIIYINMPFISKVLEKFDLYVSPEQLTQIEYKTRNLIDKPNVISSSNDVSRWHVYFEYILQVAGLSDKDKLHKAISELKEYHDKNNIWNLLPPFIPPMLRRLSKKYRLGIISNSDGSIDNLLERLGIRKYFSIIVDSYSVGYEKPNPKIFTIALEKAKASPQSSLYIGDLYYVDVVGAEKVGITCILIDPIDNHKDKGCLRIKSIEELELIIETIESKV